MVGEAAGSRPAASAMTCHAEPGSSDMAAAEPRLVGGEGAGVIIGMGGELFREGVRARHRHAGPVAQQGCRRRRVPEQYDPSAGPRGHPDGGQGVEEGSRVVEERRHEFRCPPPHVGVGVGHGLLVKGDVLAGPAIPAPTISTSGFFMTMTSRSVDDQVPGKCRAGSQGVAAPGSATGPRYD